MDYTQTLRDLEQACGDLQDAEPRLAAQRYLQEFGKRPDAIAAGKYVLAHSSVPTAMFFALDGIKESVIASFAVLGLEEALILRDDLFQLACSNSRAVESFVLEKLCWVIAVITKRTWVESSEQRRHAFVKTLCEDILQNNSPCIGILVTTNLIDEIAGGSKCSEFNLPWEFHYSCKTSFENTHMVHLFEAALKVMHRKLQKSMEARSAPTGGGRTIAYERKSALHIADRVLSWSFTPQDANLAATASFGCSRSSVMGGKPGKGASRQNSQDNDDDDNRGNSGMAILDDDDHNRTPLFPSQWRSLLLDSDVINLFFSIYEATLSDQMHAYFSPGSSHIALQCMIQISGLRGKGLFASNGSKDSDSERAQYAQVIMRNQLQVIRHVCTMDLASDGSEDIVVAATQMIRRFIEAQLDDLPLTVVAGKQLHPLALLAAGVPETLEYFNETSKLICSLLQAAAGIVKSDNANFIDDDFGDVDNYFVMQAFDELVSAWSAVINEVNEWTYLDKASETAHPNGAESTNDNGNGGAYTGHIDSRSVLTSFTQFLTTTAYMIRTQYIQLRMLMCEDSVLASDSRSETQTIDQGLLAKDYVVYEDQLQFFALLARLDIRTSMDRLYESLRSRCTVLQSEFARIENVIDGGSNDGGSQRTIDLLHEQIHWIVLMIGYTLADSGTSERVLIPGSVTEYSKTCASTEQDHTVQAIMSMLQLLQFELTIPSPALASYCSPLLAETLFWALRRIAPVYLLVDCSDYREVSQSIVTAFGTTVDGGNGAAVVGGILGLVKPAFELWISEEDVLQMCVDMLVAFAQRASIAQTITELPLFAPLMHYLINNMHRFPESTHSSIVEALTVLCCHSTSVEHERGFAELKSLILGGFSQVAAAQPQDPRVIGRILDGLDMMDGMLSAANFRNMDMIFDLLFEVQPIFEQLMLTYASDDNVPRKVIQAIESACRYLDISSLPDNEHMLRFSHNLRSILHLYQKSHQGQVVTSQASAADFESLGDVTALISAISYLVHNEMGFSPNEASPSISRQVCDDFGETEVFGIYCIHTTTTPPQLSTPNVLRAYMQLLSDMIQCRTPSLIRWLPVQTWRSILDVLVGGVDNDIYDVGHRTYEVIGKLGAFIKINGLDVFSEELGQLFRQGVQRLLSKLLRALLFSTFDAELVESAGAALVTLGLIDSDYLRLCFGELFKQSDSAVFADRLSATFSRLNAELESNEAVHAFLNSTGPIPDSIDSASLRQPLFDFLVNTRAVLRVK